MSFTALLMVTAIAALCTALAYGLEALLGLIWRSRFRAEPPADFLLILAYLGALLIAAFGLWIIPQFRKLFESFGADLPAPTLLLFKYSIPLGLLPICLLAAVHFRFRGHESRDRFLAYFLAGEFVLSVLLVMAMYLPQFRMTEAVPG